MVARGALLRFRSLVRGLATVAAVVGTSACVADTDPRRYPASLRIIGEFPGRAVARDLDGDGRDELVVTDWRNSTGDTPGPRSSVIFRDIEDQSIDQMNYDGLAQDPHLIDLDADGSIEVLTPVLRNDSLFASVSDASGRKILGFLLATGEPRQEVDGSLPWDPRVLATWVVDTNSDSAAELVTLLTTDYARLPRGVYVHSLPEGAPRGSSVVGAAPRAWTFEDFDGDGVPELLVATQATNHGATAGGLDDSKSYLLMFSLASGPAVAWTQELPLQDVARFSRTGAAGGPQDDVLLVRGGPSFEGRVLDPNGWQIRRYRELREPVIDVVGVNLDRDPGDEFVASGDGHRRVVAVDANLEVVRSNEVPFDLGYGEAWPDADGDGFEEVAFSTPTGFALLTPGLGIKAVFAGGAVVSVQRRGIGEPARVVIANGSSTMLAHLVPNRFYLIYRYGGSLLGVILAIGGVGGVTAARRRLDRFAVFEAATARLMEVGWTGLLLFDHRGTLTWAHPQLAAGRAALSTVRDLTPFRPDLGEFCTTLLAQEAPTEASTTVANPLDPRGPDRTARAIPIEVPHRAGVHWAVGLVPPSAPESGTLERDDPTAWPLMAQRIAHGIKNPLTHMLLTLQRLQAEYHRRAPAVASRLDPYSDRIVDGIGELRRLTSSFLKVVDLQGPELEDVDVNELVTAFAASMRSRTPPDIRLRVDPGHALPMVRLDREQIEMALENLTINSINALDRGGTITIATMSLPNVHHEAGDPRSWVEIEVIDTGTGIPSHLGKDVLEAGVTSMEGGSGLGLAIVRKIARDHGGDIRFTSEDGVGTVFTLRLPVKGPEVEAEA